MLDVDTRTSVVDSDVPALLSLVTLPAFAGFPPDRHPVAVYLARLAVSSRATMKAALEDAATRLTGGRLPAEHLPWHQLDYQHVNALRARLAKDYAPSTGNRILAATRGCLKECWRLGYMPLEQQVRACDIPPIRGERLPKGRALTPEEVQGLFQVCAEDASPAGRRDAAMLAILYGAGLRRSEVVNLDADDYHPTTGELIVRAGKGNKDRRLYAGNGSADALREWLDLRGREPGPLFVAITKGGRLRPRRLTDKAVTWILANRTTAAGIAACSPHDMRRSYISSLLSCGVDISTVASLAGHASISTTARYDRRGDEMKRKAAHLLIVPFIGRTS